MTRNTPRLCFIGFGEAGQAFASGLRGAGVTTMAAWDILFADAAGARLRAVGEELGVRLGSSAADAIKGSDIVIAAVTAASSLEAAQQAKPYLKAEQLYLDINSVSPGRKQATAKLLGGRARYVDVAVIAPIHPARHKTPLLIAGPHAEAIAPLLERAGRFAYVLCRTSNPGAGELQDLEVAADTAAGFPAEPLHVRLARRAVLWNERYGTVGLVVGATAPREMAVLRGVAPDLGFLVPSPTIWAQSVAAAVEASACTAEIAACRV